MNKRARQRLIGVTVLVLVVVGAIIFGASQGVGAGAYKKSVAEVLQDDSLIGKQVQVQGPVVPGSWTPGSDPLTFSIRQMDDDNGPTLGVVWDGPVPSAFGDGTIAIVTGIVGEDKVVTAKTLITQCPSKYASATDALTVDALLKSDLMGKPVAITGYVVNGSIQPAGTDPRFVVGTMSSGGTTIDVTWDGALPQGFEEGVKVVIKGSLTSSGTYQATDVALEESQAK
ncbi:MAG: cytochrome c maturation protein CcmE [Coriobacteriales bacterium]|nr:cytochrome c maturation protein CcmE [Actinomycetes bacterium]